MSFIIHRNLSYKINIFSGLDFDISTFCHNYPEPVFITKNGKDDLAVMSIEAYEEMTSRFELYNQIKEGMDDIAIDNTRPFSESMADIRNRHSR